MSKSSSANPHKTLTRLITANIILDITAIAIWAALPANTWNGMYRLDSLIAGSEAALAAAFFAVTLCGLKRRQKWAPILAITLTVTQRVFAVYVSKYSDTNTSDLEFNNNLFCLQRNKNFKKRKWSWVLS
jgi:hypothetical protein